MEDLATLIFSLATLVTAATTFVVARLKWAKFIRTIPKGRVCIKAGMVDRSTETEFLLSIKIARVKGKDRQKK